MDDIASASEEFDRALQKAGLSVSPERRDSLLMTYIHFQRQIGLLRGRRPDLEPAGVFRLPITEIRQ